jgi:phage tail sheath gpL-like
MGGVVLSGCRAAEADDFTGAQKIQLLKYGSTTFSEVGGFLSIDRVQGTCYLAGDGARDERYLDSPKLWLAEWAIGDMHSVIAAEYARMRLVSSSSGRVPDLCATPGMVEGTLRAWYRSLCNRGYAQNADVFDGAVSCTRPDDDRNRLDASVPANLADNFEIFAPVLSFS